MGHICLHMGFLGALEARGREASGFGIVLVGCRDRREGIWSVSEIWAVLS